MKKIVGVISLASAALLIYAVQITAVNAESVDSDATIKAIEGTDPVSPVDPLDPNQPGTNPGEEGNTTGQGGPLQINYVSNLLFGNEVKLTGKTVETGVKNTMTPYFQVSDLRGTGAGWSLSVSLSDFVNENDSKNVIKGASIAFDDGTVRTTNSLSGNAATANNIKLEAGSQASLKILEAAKGSGRGTWLVAYDKVANQTENSKIRFSAPVESIDTDVPYEANLTWQLGDIPTAD